MISNFNTECLQTVEALVKILPTEVVSSGICIDSNIKSEKKITMSVYTKEQILHLLSCVLKNLKEE